MREIAYVVLDWETDPFAPKREREERARLADAERPVPRIIDPRISGQRTLRRVLAGGR